MKSLLILTIAIFGLCSSCSNQENGDQIAKDISSEDMVKIITKNDLIILDVRTPGETAEGKIPNAIEIDFNGGDFEKKIEKLDKDKPVYIYCAAGGRSKKAQSIMQEKGFKETYNLLGGFGEWKSKGLPIN